MKSIAPPIGSASDLASKLGLEWEEVEKIAGQSDDQRYRPVEAPAKVDGSTRSVFNPTRDIRRVQRRLANRIFKPAGAFIWPSYLFGGIANSSLQDGAKPRDYVSCASMHCGARSALKLDIKAYFDNVDDALVGSVFKDLMGWSQCASDLATNLCTRAGSLPQGGLTSSYIALLCLHDVESDVAAILGRKGLVYTRYVDDITVSSKTHGHDFGLAKRLIEGMLASKGLALNKEKSRELRSGTTPIEVHGLRVDGVSPLLPQREIKRIRAAIFTLNCMAKDVGRRSIAYRSRYCHVLGVVNKLARVGNRQHPKLVKKVLSIQPLPSDIDYKLARDVAHRLREIYDKTCNTFSYRSSFHKLMERLNLISIENPSWASTLRTYMTRHFSPKPELE